MGGLGLSIFRLKWPHFASTEPCCFGAISLLISPVGDVGAGAVVVTASAPVTAPGYPQNPWPDYQVLLVKRCKQGIHACGHESSNAAAYYSVLRIRNRAEQPSVPKHLRSLLSTDVPKPSSRVATGLRARVSRVRALINITSELFG